MWPLLCFLPPFFSPCNTYIYYFEKVAAAAAAVVNVHCLMAWLQPLAFSLVSRGTGEIKFFDNTFGSVCFSRDMNEQGQGSKR